MNIPLYAIVTACIAFSVVCGLLFTVDGIRKGEKEFFEWETSMMEATYLRTIAVLTDKNSQLVENNRELLAQRDTLHAERNRLDVDKLKSSEEIRVLKASESQARKEIYRLKKYINRFRNF